MRRRLVISFIVLPLAAIDPLVTDSIRREVQNARNWVGELGERGCEVITNRK